MKNLLVTPLVNWGMGAAIIGVFALVCVVLVFVVYSMASSDKKAKDSSEESH
ncbi:hypothetical protein [Patiriisocius marinus]|uniref:DUF3149 domain-containing protein n=1 Tax=Patiriisocius marinus TaxID=1397112 RepID=A0A5J4IWC8_9FLAO|nr:hypothetical protein [Patiriisocius marinus]GER58090.1 hypothetical protein ULMA_01980 [Patiriisocius marinus]